MRILLVHNTYLHRGGEDTVFQAERDLLLQHGHEVEALIFHNEDLLSVRDQIIGALWSIYNPRAFRLMTEKIRAFCPDIIHVHNFFYQASLSIFFAARKLRVPVVMTLHNYRLLCPSAYLFHNGEVYLDNVSRIFPFSAVKNRVWKNSLLATFTVGTITAAGKLLGVFRNMLAGMIVFTAFSRDLFLDSSLRPDPEKVFIKPNFTADPGRRISARDSFFVYVGRLSEEKGIPMLLDAFADLKKELKIIGDGPLADQVESIAAVNHHITYLGKKPRKEVLELLSRATALVFCSAWYEGMPMVLLEAMSMGTPVISAEMGNHGNMITAEKNGLLYSPGNKKHLQEQILRLANDPALVDILSEGSRQEYEEKYHPDANYQTLNNIYQSILRRRDQ